MTQSPLVSIVIPSYNQAQFLETTLLSVLNQDYPRMEVIVVDGESTDSSKQIIEKYASKLTWWVSEKDRGQADAINKGMEHAKGDILAWLNSDDIYLPGTITGIVDLFRQYPETGFVYGDGITIDENGVPLNPLRFGEWKIDELCQFRIICQPAVFFRREVWEESGGLDLSYHYMLDHQLWIRMALFTSIMHLPRYLAGARYHSQAKNVAQAQAFADEIERILKWIKTDASLGKIYRKNKSKVEGGAYRLMARYLLDGGYPAKALFTYTKAMMKSPLYTLKHWHRMIFSLVYLLGGKDLEGMYRKYFQKRSAFVESLQDLRGWHGIFLD